MLKKCAIPHVPEYRLMGHMWNNTYFFRNKGLSFPFEKSLVPLVPIVQCNGINAGPGCSGGPLFNMEGEGRRDVGWKCGWL